MTALRPFFSFYGSKWAAAKRYPAPVGRTLVEPFAGSAGYSLRYPDRAVTLVESDPVVAGIWRYLLGATAAQVREARWLPFRPLGDIKSTRGVSSEAVWVSRDGGRAAAAV